MKGLLALLMAIMMVFLLVACGETKTEDTITEDTLSADTKRVAIADDCWEHVTNLNVVEQGDGTVEVTLTAPDYDRASSRALSSRRRDSGSRISPQPFRSMWKATVTVSCVNMSVTVSAKICTNLRKSPTSAIPDGASGCCLA